MLSRRDEDETISTHLSSSLTREEKFNPSFSRKCLNPSPYPQHKADRVTRTPQLCDFLCLIKREEVIPRYGLFTFHSPPYSPIALLPFLINYLPSSTTSDVSAVRFLPIAFSNAAFEELY